MSKSWGNQQSYGTSRMQNGDQMRSSGRSTMNNGNGTIYSDYRTTVYQRDNEWQRKTTERMGVSDFRHNSNEQVIRRQQQMLQEQREINRRQMEERRRQEEISRRNMTEKQQALALNNRALAQQRAMTMQILQRERMLEQRMMRGGR